MRARAPLAVVLAIFGVAFAPSPAQAAEGERAGDAYDVVVYGGTSAGVAAAVQAARLSRSAVVVEPTRHLGGLSSGGLGATDIGNKQAIGGIAREFYRRIRKHYDNPAAWKQQTFEQYRKGRPHGASGAPGEDTMWTFEPHVARKVFEDMLAEAKVPVVLGERLDLKAGVERKGGRIASITMESGRKFRGLMFVDATYEGDLMAKAGVTYHVGREANATYGESLNGVQARRAVSHQFEKPVDPYVKPGDSSSGLLPGIHAGPPGEEGQGDRRVQAYNFRLCLTDVPENQVPFPKPANYDPLRYELLLRYLEAGWNQVFGNHQMMPNRKSDMNNHGAFSSDNIGMNYDYPDGDYAKRERILAEHRDYQMGFMWTVVNNVRVPKAVREKVGRWGLAKDEFRDNGNWPPQLYVREARRMTSEYVMTEHNCRGTRVAEDPAGMAAYNMDSHNVQRYVDAGGHARNEGDIQVGVRPYPISFRSIRPKATECANLLVPVCLSSSHIAYGSIRMEPVFMVLGQSAATAAAQAIEQKRGVQEIDYPRLRARLEQDKQVLELRERRPEKTK
jgi:hypothetical protein